MKPKITRPRPAGAAPSPEVDAERRLRELAATFNCVTESDFCFLAGITLGTADAWRRRGTGPSYIRLGNQVLYRVDAVNKFLDAQTRERAGVEAKTLL